MAYQVIQDAKFVQCDETGQLGICIGDKVYLLDGTVV